MTEFDIDVCTDCYFAHHYGFHSIERPATDIELWHRSEAEWNTYHAREIMGLTFFTAGDAEETWMVREWFAGDSDSRCEGGEPLSQIADAPFDLSDNTCSDHYVEQIAEDELTDQDTTTCEHCGQWGHEDGLTEFSSSSCDGCGCRLGGSRFRLRVKMREVNDEHALVPSVE